MSEVPQVKRGVCLVSHALTPSHGLLSGCCLSALVQFASHHHMKPSKGKGYVLLVVVVYQTLPRLLIITPITLIPDESSDPLAVCLQVINRKDVMPPIRQVLWVLLFQPVLTLSQ